MIRVGITGQSGFVGTHLYNTLGLHPDKFKRITFEDSFFDDNEILAKFVSECDVVVHLAAMNRHNDQKVIFETNVELVQKLIAACETSSAKPHILFSSSTQEELNNLYGSSKREGRGLFEQWATKNGSSFTGFIIPNVFGPFGNPFYNSVVATFCHQLTHAATPRIDVDGELKLIYIGKLITDIIGVIESKANTNTAEAIQKIIVPHSYEIRVSGLLKKLTAIKDNYFKNGMIPDLGNSLEINLFHTFLTYVDHQSFFPFHLRLNTDDRGSFIETIRLNSGGQVSFSTTKPGITRGNHFHTRKAERFAVIKGNARIEIRRIGTNNKLTFELDGSSPSFVDMPLWFTHNITNIGKEELYTIFWVNEFFDPADPDTYFEQV
jgi:UDP-2-acetamido-2,6-beta-L-arabino-hexul-4-ose reductase